MNALVLRERRAATIDMDKIKVLERQMIVFETAIALARIPTHHLSKRDSTALKNIAAHAIASTDAKNNFYT